MCFGMLSERWNSSSREDFDLFHPPQVTRFCLNSVVSSFPLFPLTVLQNHQVNLLLEPRRFTSPSSSSISWETFIVAENEEVAGKEKPNLPFVTSNFAAPLHVTWEQCGNEPLASRASRGRSRKSRFNALWLPVVVPCVAPYRRLAHALFLNPDNTESLARKGKKCSPGGISFRSER